MGACDADDVRASERTNWRLRFLEADLAPHEHDQLSAVLISGDLTPLDPAEKAAWTGQLDQVGLASDGALPFRDNVDHAARHGVRIIAEPGGSIRSRDVDIACQQHNITRIATDIPRLFHH
jgi:phosphoribosylaminoimidazolecarboxamide formyltransferase/IMP cyclohydrolase